MFEMEDIVGAAAINSVVVMATTTRGTRSQLDGRGCESEVCSVRGGEVGRQWLKLTALCECRHCLRMSVVKALRSSSCVHPKREESMVNMTCSRTSIFLYGDKHHELILRCSKTNEATELEQKTTIRLRIPGEST